MLERIKRRMKMSEEKRATNIEYAATNQHFQEACAAVGVKPTSRQASRWRNGKGRAAELAEKKRESPLPELSDKPVSVEALDTETVRTAPRGTWSGRRSPIPSKSLTAARIELYGKKEKRYTCRCGQANCKRLNGGSVSSC